MPNLPAFICGSVIGVVVSSANHENLGFDLQVEQKIQRVFFQEEFLGSSRYEVRKLAVWCPHISESMLNLWSYADLSPVTSCWSAFKTVKRSLTWWNTLQRCVDWSIACLVSNYPRLKTHIYHWGTAEYYRRISYNLFICQYISELVNTSYCDGTTFWFISRVACQRSPRAVIDVALTFLMEWWSDFMY